MLCNHKVVLFLFAPLISKMEQPQERAYFEKYRVPEIPDAANLRHVASVVCLSEDVNRSYGLARLITCLARVRKISFTRRREYMKKTPLHVGMKKGRSLGLLKELAFRNIIEENKVEFKRFLNDLILERPSGDEAYQYLIESVCFLLDQGIEINETLYTGLDVPRPQIFRAIISYTTNPFSTYEHLEKLSNIYFHYPEVIKIMISTCKDLTLTVLEYACERSKEIAVQSEETWRIRNPDGTLRRITNTMCTARSSWLFIRDRVRDMKGIKYDNPFLFLLDRK